MQPTWKIQASCIFFNLGRIASYVVLGGLIGYAGSLFQLSTFSTRNAHCCCWFSYAASWRTVDRHFPVLKKISFTLPKGIHRMLGIQEKSEDQYSNKNAALMGAMTFFFLWIYSGHAAIRHEYRWPITGALTMGVFAPWYSTGASGCRRIDVGYKRWYSKVIFKTAGVVVISLAFLMSQTA